jgi:hypothetical protein
MTETTFAWDQPLRLRMGELGLASWSALQQKARVSRHTLHQIRRGAVHQLRLQPLQAVAAALDWSLPDLLQTLGVAAWEQPQPTDAGSLRQECLRLRQQLQHCRDEVMQDQQQQIFQHLQSLLTGYPTARHMADHTPTLPARNLKGLFTPLDTLLSHWGIEPIGTAWEQVSFDPQLHQPDSPEIARGEPVYIRFVGYRYRSPPEEHPYHILCPAKVSRSLPGGSH